MTPKLIKNQKEHDAALARIEELFSAVSGTPEGDELELLVHLVDAYESTAFPIDLPDPIAAVRFRMEQQGLKRKDLERYLGSKSKVSEVLNGQRDLSLAMIRKLHEGLGIPAEVLLQEPGAKLPSKEGLKIGSGFPVTEMHKRGWFDFDGTALEVKRQWEEVLASFVAPLGGRCVAPVLNRQLVRDGGKSDAHALRAWRIRVMSLACRRKLPKYEAGRVTRELIESVVRLSYLDEGPLLARELLNKQGVHVVTERHLPKTYLDGAAFAMPDGSRLVALTLRHDRLDNFWFTLAHELAHIHLHLDAAEGERIEAAFDNLKTKGVDEREREADELAGELLVPADAWKRSRLGTTPSRERVIALAEDLRISPAVVAGRVQFERDNYGLFANLIGRGHVRRLFETD